MKTLEQKIKLLEDELQKAVAKKQAIDEKQIFLKNQRKRITDNKKKYLIGAAVLNNIKNPESEFIPRLNALLDKYLTRATDRAVFDFPPLPGHPAKPPKTLKTPKVKVEKSLEPTPGPSSSS